jgi:hypothetical protein
MTSTCGTGLAPSGRGSPGGRVVNGSDRVKCMTTVSMD